MGVLCVCVCVCVWGGGGGVSSYSSFFIICLLLKAAGLICRASFSCNGLHLRAI